jgi:CBS domain-containing membrane protein
LPGDFDVEHHASGARPRIFAPILAGASLHDRLMACLGAGLGLAVMALVCGKIAPFAHLPALAAPIGASALLVFAVPASPLAQPWPVIGGNVISAAVGVRRRLDWCPTSRWRQALALALAYDSGHVPAALGLHPRWRGCGRSPPVIGGAAVTHMGYALPLRRHALAERASLARVAAGLAGVSMRFSKQRGYPHRAGPKRFDARRPAPRGHRSWPCATWGETFGHRRCRSGAIAGARRVALRRRAKAAARRAARRRPKP